VFPVRRNRWVTFDCYGTLVGGGNASPFRPHDDVEPLLADLRRRGYRLGVLTNWDDATFEAAHRSFRRPFDLFVTSERVRGFKPDLWHFRAFKLLTQVQKDNWVHVASDWKHDIVPAESFGIPTVWLDRDGTGETSTGGGGAHVRTASEAVRAVDWLFQDQAVCAS
jgi:2-haloacid dehalogenase